MMSVFGGGAKRPILSPPVFTLTAQSNGTTASTSPAGPPVLPPYLVTPDAGIQIWNGSAFVTLQNGVNNNILNSAQGDYASVYQTRWGPEASFLNAFRQVYPNTTVYLVKKTLTGTALFNDGTANNWNSDPAAAPNLFSAMTPIIAAALAALTSPFVPAHLMFNGEADASNGTWAAAYQTNQEAFFSAAQSQWGNSSTQILVAGVNPLEFGSGITTVAAAQLAACNNHPTISQFISTANHSRFPLQSDDFPIHEAASGIVNLGLDMFNAWYKTWNV